MGRKAIYATLNTYQPYIDIIRKDLGIDQKVFIDIQFNTQNRYCELGRPSGYAWTDGKFYKIRVSKFFTHNATLQFLMHELKHVEQMVNGRLTNPKDKGWRWLNKPVELIHPKVDHKGYMGQEWEAEAYSYQETVSTLFPNDKLPPERKLVGAIGGTTFYKVIG